MNNQGLIMPVVSYGGVWGEYPLILKQTLSRPMPAGDETTLSARCHNPEVNTTTGRPIRSRKRTTVTTLLAVAALLWQTLLPLLPAPRAADGDLVVMCTEHGLRMVSLDGRSSVDGQTPTPSAPGKVDCPLCASLHLTAGGLAGGSTAFHAPAALSPVSEYAGTIFSAPLRRNQLARAPPLFA